MTRAKTFIVTGGNSGLGFECASALAQDSSVLVIIACRDVQQGEQAAQRMRDARGNVKVLPLDLAKQASIRAVVDAFRKGDFPPLASGSEGSATGKYFSDGREVRSSAASYDTQNALDLWNRSAEMTGLPTELERFALAG